MTELGARRVPLWKVVTALFLFCGVIAGGLWLWIRSATERKWAALAKEVNGLKAQAGTRGGRRPTLSLDPEPGNAWIDYRLGVAQLGGGNQLAWSLEELLDEADPKGRPRIAQFAKTSESALEHMRNGVRKAEAHHPIDWERLVFSGLPGGERTLGLAALCTVRSLRDSNSSGEALDLLLDAAIFARDVAHDGFLESHWDGFSLLNRVLDEIRSRVASDTLSRADSLKIERALEAVDRGFPVEGVSTLNVIALIGNHRLRNVPWNQMFGSVHIEIKGPSSPGWRFAYSMRLMEADAFERWLTMARRFGSTRERSWAEAQALDAEARELILGAPANGIAEVLSNCWSDSYRRATLARLRVLRMAAVYRGTGEIRPLVDPFGTTLVTSSSGDRLRIWSVGEDGVDDSGSGDWKPGPGKDIVLEVER